jgi:hypothetical protein
VCLAVAWLLFSDVARADPPKKKASRDDRIAAGITLFVDAYAYPVLMGSLVYRKPDGTIPTDLMIPFAGPYLAIAKRDISVESLVAYHVAKAMPDGGEISLDSFTVGDVLEIFLVQAIKGLEFAVLAIDPIMQGTGIAIAGVGAASPHTKSGTTDSGVHPKISFTPIWMSGPGVGLSVTSW